MVTSRIWFTAAQKAELWERWKNGQSAILNPRAGIPSALAHASLAHANRNFHHSQAR